METRIEEKGEMHFVGLQARTNNENESDMQKARIILLWKDFMENNLMMAIPNKVDTMTASSLYSDYASDVNGDYTVTVGSMTSNPNEIPQGMHAKSVGASKYLVFTTPKGKLPEVVVAAWQYIWQYFKNEPEHTRNYKGDFEVYDHRCIDPANAQVDIYIGIK